MLHARLPRSEEFSENVTVRSEISTWRVVLAVTFGILFEEKKNWIVNPTKYLSEICKNRTIEVGAAKLFSVNSSWT